MLRRKRLAMLVAEFLGTGVLTLAVLSVQRSQLGLSYFVAIAAGLAVALLTYVLGNVSGAHFNPALTLGLWSARRVKTLPALGYIVAQLLGAWAAYALYHFFVRTAVQEVTQAFNWRILIAEAVGAMIFTLAWAAAAYNRADESRFATLAGLGFTVGVVVASAASIGLINPALALGVRAWEVFGQNGLWNYLVGPIAGGLLGVNLYGLLFADSERPFGALRGRPVTAGVTGGTPMVETAVVEEEVVMPAPKRRTSRAAATGSTSSTSSSSSRVKKTSASRSKSTASRRKR